MINPYQKLEQKLGYRFKNKRFLEKALTHPSWRHEQTTPSNISDNQRLEFLGDAVLSFVTAEFLYRSDQQLQEGDMTRRRSMLTRNHTLATLASDLELGKYLKMGKGEEQLGGRNRVSNLEDAMEALVGAVYLDGSLKAVQKLFHRLFMPLLKEPFDQHHHNPKGTLQELCQHHWKKNPQYTIRRSGGEQHAPKFQCTVLIDQKELGTGTGTSKREASAAAAENAIQNLNQEPRA